MVAAAAVLLVVMTAGLVLVHLPPVQRRAWSKIVESVAAETGWRLEARSVRFRLFPAVLVIDGFGMGTGDAQPIAADHLEIRFSWRRLMGTPRSVDRVVIEGLEVDGTQFELPEPTGSPQEPPAVDPWRTLEIAELSLADGRLVAAGGGVGLNVQRLSIAGALREGTAEVEIDAGSLAVDRDGRRLDAGRLVIAARAAASGVTLDRVRLDGANARLIASGDLSVSPAVAGTGTITAEADLPALVSWWDPGLVDVFSPEGRLAIDAGISYAPDGGFEINIHQRGDPVGISGFSVSNLAVEHGGGVTRASAELVGLGTVELASVGAQGYRLVADVGEVRIARLLALVNRPAIDVLPEELTVGGEVEATFVMPINLETAAAGGRLVVRWPEGHVEIEGSGGGRDWDLRRLELEVPGAIGSGRGALAGGSITADVHIQITDPAALARAAGPWVPAIAALAVGGGPISLDLRASGALENPYLEADLDWIGPEVGGASMDELRAAISGTLDDLGWNVELRPGPGALVSADGRAGFPELSVTGSWAVTVDSIVDLELVRRWLPQEISGELAATGHFRWQGGDSWKVAGFAEAGDVGVGGWLVDEASARFELGPGGGSVADARLRMGTATLELDADLLPLSLQGDLQAAVRVEGLDLGQLGLGEAARGSLRATVAVGGTPSEPVLVGDLDWADDAEVAIADPVRMHLTLESGRFEAVTETWRTVAGPIQAEVDIPLGDLPRPEWFWPDSPTGPIRARLTGIGLTSSPLVAALGLDPLPGEASGDVNVEVAWDLSGPGSRLVLVEIDGLTAKGAHMDLTAQETVRLRFLDNRLEVESVSLVGPRSRVELGGVYDLGSRRLVGAADLSLDARVVEMLPFPIRATGPIRIQAGVDGPMEGLTATLLVDHEGGSIVMRDPAVELTDLRLRVEIDDGVVWIQDGEAGLNQGRLWIGGGWDPAIRQGVVLEFEDVKALLGTSIVTSWSGAVAIEPDPERLALVVGELGLNAGVWERPFDLKGAFFGSDDVAPEEDDPLADIGLDLQVAGYGGIKVDNNLGRFDASWGILEVGGTVARPDLVGTVRLAPGGTVNLPGQTVTIRRATLDFTGNPDTDPVMEIVPEKYSVGLGGSEGGGGLDTRLLAAETLARSAGSVLGLENTTLQPAEVAFETQTDASSAFTAGQRLTRNVAIFLTTDLSDVQRQTTMLQLWNLRGLPGLALQGYTKTGEADHGGNLIERYRWGGGAGTDDRPVIQKIKFDGEWPIGRRRLLKTTGLRKGEPFEPFLLFAAGLRLEGALAELGYSRARVRGEAAGDPKLPALIFTVDPGPRVDFEFTGDQIPAHVRRAATSLYLEPPLEEGSFLEIRRTVIRHLLGEGFPDAEVTVERVADAVVVTSHRGEKSVLNGPLVVGLSDADSASLRRHAGTALMLAELVREPELAARLVERWLRVEGYPEAKLEEVWVTDRDDGTRWVNLRIDPGPRQRLGRVEVVGEDPLGLTSGGVPDVEAGMPLDRRAIDQALGRLRSRYRAAGYPDVAVSMSLQSGDTAEPSMVVTLEPGSQRTVRQVEVTGLRYIRESVILKGLTVEPGQILLASDLDTSAVRTAFFAPVEKANVNTRDVGLNVTDVTFDVTEKTRWAVEAGAGWSTERGASVQAGFRDDGLLGRGAGLSLRTIWDERQHQATLYASLPPPPGGRWSMVGNFLWFDGDSRSSPDSFKEEQVGGAVEATYRVTDTTSLRGYLRRQRTVTELKHPEDLPPGLAPDPVTSHETIVGSQFVWDRMDNPFDPRRGSAVAVDLSHNAPNLGSDLNDLRLVLTGSLVTEPRGGWTWAQTLRLGGVEGLGGMIPVFNRKFVAGGQATVRGFDLDSIGPVIPAGGGGYKAKGGGALFVLNEEVRIPIVANIRAAVFADVGQVWETWGDATLEFSVGAGFGLRLSTPVGPLWADVAWPVANPNISSPGAKYYFGLGTNF